LRNKTRSHQTAELDLQDQASIGLMEQGI